MDLTEESNDASGVYSNGSVNGATDLTPRLSALEQRVAEQADEISGLKAALADVTLRLNSMEAIKAAGDGGSASGARKGSAPPKSSGVKKRPVSEKPESARSARSARLSLPPTKPATKSTAKTTARRTGKSMSKRQEATYDADEGVLRLYMRGRPLNLAAPSQSSYSLGDSLSAPDNTLKLDWVHGYRGRDCRNNVHLLPTGELVYFVASVVVLQHPEQRTQRHYTAHTDDIKCIAIHPDRVRIASGQVTGHAAVHGEAHVRVWDSVSLQTLQVLGESDFQRAVCCVAFSRQDSGALLCCVDESNDHVLSVWDWQKQKKIAESKSSADPVLAAEFQPQETGSLVTCGKNHLSFWTLDGNSLVKKSGLYEKQEKPRFVLCMAFSDSGDLLTGDSNGTIFLWPKGGQRISQAVVGAHEGGIFSLCFLRDGTLLSGGGKDRTLIHWDQGLQRTGFTLTLNEEWGPVRTIAQGADDTFFVGTTRNVILHGSTSVVLSPLVQAHSDELWGLCVHPTQPQLLTAGFDKQLRAWDTLSHSCIWSVELQEAARCLCYHPGGQLVCIGMRSGTWAVLDTESRELVHSQVAAPEQISSVQYSPDGSKLAASSHDNAIYVYNVSEDGREYTAVGKCTGHSSFVTYLDWSADSHVIRTNSGDYEALFWNGANCSQITSAADTRDLKWASQNCALSFNCAGIWPEDADGTDINGCCRGHNEQLMATADDFGKVKLFRYPCPQIRAGNHEYAGHSSHVTSVAFVCDDTRLISTGGQDTAVFQWEVL